MNTILPYNVLSSPVLLNQDPSILEDTTDLDFYEKSLDNLKKAFLSGKVSQEVANLILNFNDNKLDYFTFINLGLTIATFAIPELGIVTPFIGMFFSIFGHSSSSPPPTIHLNVGDLFKAMQPAIEQMINQALTNLQIDAMNNKVEELKKYLQSYTDAVNNFSTLSSPSDTDIADFHSALNNTITILNANVVYFGSSQSDSSSPSDQAFNAPIAGLPYYTFFTTMKLMLMSDRIKNGRKWGYNPENFSAFQQELDEAITTHSKHVYSTYQTYVDANSTYLGDQNIWHFQDNMLKHCLIPMATWPTYSPIDYPTPSNLHQTLTRTVDTKYRQKFLQFQEFDIPNTLTSFKQAGFGPGLESTIGLTSTGLRSSSTPIQGRLYVPYDQFPHPSVSLGRNRIISAKLSDVIAGIPQGLTFRFDKGLPELIIGGEENADWVTLPGQFFSRLYEDNDKDLYSTSITAYTENVIGRPVLDEDNKATGEYYTEGIPFEKNYARSGSFAPEVGNGAGAIKLSRGQSVSLGLQNITAGYYEIRLRYASAQTNSQVFINMGFDPYHVMYHTATFQATGGKGIPGVNGDYVLTTIGTHFLPETGYWFIISSQSPHDFYVDRLEFVPVPASETVSFSEIIAVQPETTNHPYLEYPIWQSPLRDRTAKQAQITGTVTAPDNVTLQRVVALKDGKEVSSITDVDVSQPINWSLSTEFDTITLEFENSATDKHGVRCDLEITLHYFTEATDRTNSSSVFSKNQDLEQIKNMTHALFSSFMQTDLAKEAHDYWIDQVAMKVNALSDEVFGKEKHELRQLVNKAKQLSKSRNLLIGGNFEDLSNWKLSRDTAVISEHELFQHAHVLLPPAVRGPSYVYQHIEESKLKPYTRYTVRGFIAHGKPLEIMASRYKKELSDTVHVPYEEAYPITSEATENCCVPTETELDSHFFTYHIDVGSLQSEANLGLQFGLKVSDPKGMARVSNLEIVEDRPLTTAEQLNVMKKEKKWKAEYQAHQTEMTELIKQTTDQINALYQSNDPTSSIKPQTSYRDIQSITLPDLPNQKHWFMTDRQGEGGTVLQSLQLTLDQASAQLENRNLIHNGNFTKSFEIEKSWTPHGDVTIEPLENGSPALHLSHWDASVTQTIAITDFDEDQEYQLRVYGKGKGTVTLQHGENSDIIATMHFTSKDIIMKTLPSLFFETSSIEVRIMSEDGEFVVDSIELIEMIPEIEFME